MTDVKTSKATSDYLSSMFYLTHKYGLDVDIEVCRLKRLGKQRARKWRFAKFT